MIRYRVNGRELTKAEWDARPKKEGVPYVMSSRIWPARIDNLQVHPSQAEELRQFHKSHGVSAEVANDGSVTFESRREYIRALNCRGIIATNEIAGNPIDGLGNGKPLDKPYHYDNCPRIEGPKE
jgi:hypothetical protein